MRNRLILGLSCLLAGPGLAGDLAFVTNQNSSDLSIIDLDQQKEIRRVDVAGKPAGVAVVPEWDAAFTVSPETKTISKLNRAGEVVDLLLLEGGPIGIVADVPRDRLFVSDWYNARIWIIDARAFVVIDTLTTGSAPAGLAVSEDGTWLASADRDADQVTIFAMTGFDVPKSITVGERPFGLTFGPDGNLYAGNVGSDTVTVVAPKSGEIIATIPTGARPYAIAFALGHGFVTNQYEDSVTVFSIDNHEVTGTIDVGEYPEGIDVSKDQSKVFVANWFSNNLMVIDAATLGIIGKITTGDGPRAFGQFVWEDKE